jgi:hypothetical protein
MIRDILLMQKTELERKLKEKYIERTADLKVFDSRLIKVIIGPRRAGKSFFAVHALTKMGSFGYVNLDDERLLGIKDYDDIINTLNSVYAKSKYLLFDEIQNLDRWELFVNRLQRQGYNIVITGSNSKLLSKELATHLTGRHLQISIFPFSFKELIKSEGKELTKSEIKAKLATYLNNGGYPEPFVQETDYKDYLSTLFSSVIYKDIVKRFKIRSTDGIETLATYLISNVAKEFSYNTLTKVTKCKSVHTIEKYLSYLEETFIFFKLNRFSFKLKEQIKANKKIYCIDNGFITAKAFKISPDTGRLYENLVAIELNKQEIKGDINVYYWKSLQQEEVDFVIKRGLKVDELIQVCYETTDSKTLERELRALLKASKELKCNKLIVITEDEEKESKINWFGIKRKIRFIPLWKWLLQES